MFVLDGLRGWMALTVVLYHTTLAFFPGEENKLLLVIGNGALAVYVFFVISGFSASFAFITTGDKLVVIRAALARYPRLTLPILTSCSLAYLVFSAGLMYNIPAAAAAGTENWLGCHYRFSPSLLAMLEFSIYDVYFFGDNARSWNSVLWIMPIEIVGSFMVYGIILFTGRWRRLVVGVMLPGCFWLGSHLTAFLLGIVLAEIAGWGGFRHWRISRSAAATSVFVLLLALGLANWGGVYLTAPPAMSVTAALVVLAVLGSARVSVPLEGRVSQWLGRRSFSIYLTHLIVICSASSSLYLELAHAGFSGTVCRVATLVATLVIAVLVGHLFEPVERLSHLFTLWLTGLIWPPLAVRPG
ncbi:MAG: acyltransferase [Rhodospirillaceae bacterium]